MEWIGEMERSKGEWVDGADNSSHVHTVGLAWKESGRFGLVNGKKAALHGRSDKSFFGLCSGLKLVLGAKVACDGVYLGGAFAMYL